VLCSAYSDTPWDEIIAKFAETDRLLILKKPFDPVEVRQMASALTEKWNQRLESLAVESALRKSEAQSRGLLQALPDTIRRVRRDGTCMELCGPSERPAEKQAGLFTRRHVDDVLPEEPARALMSLIEKAITDDATEVFEYQDRRTGEVRVHEARVARIDQAEALMIIRDVTDRRRAEAELERRRLHEEAVRAQVEALRALSTPLIPITDDIVIMPLVGSMDVERMQEVRRTLTEGIASHATRVAIIDVTGVPSLDTEVAAEMLLVAHAARLLGARTMLTGMRPDVARALVAQPLDLGGVLMHRTLQSGVASAMRER
jgi:anti-anti-sigma regulatory factor/PAS domain-containing protein